MKKDPEGGGNTLLALRLSLIEAAINAYTRDAGESKEYWEFESGSVSAGGWTFRYWNQVTYKLDYPTGAWTYSHARSNGFQPLEGTEPFPTTAKWASIETEFANGLARWESMPTTHPFSSQITSLGEVAVQLASGGSTVAGSGSDVTISIGNKVLDSYLTTLEAELDHAEGDYVENLRKFVNDRLRDVISGYHALTAVAGALVAGEQDMWERTDTEYIDLLKSGISNFSAYAERASDSDDGSKTLSVVGAIIGAAGVFATGPVAPVALGLLGTTVSLVDTFMPEPPKAEEVNVYGSSYEDINTKFWESEEKLASSIRATENAFHDAGANAREKTTSDPRAFDMRRQMQFLGSTGEGLYGPGDRRIKVGEDLKDCAPHFELVGDLLREAAKTASGIPDPEPWRREGGLGRSSIGHYLTYKSLVDRLVDLLLDAAKEMHLYAEKCLLVYHDFNATDAQIETELDQQANKIEKRVTYEVG